MYGHKWTSAYGETDDGTWIKGLAGLSLEQISHGLRECLKRNDPWPPSLPEFRAMCVIHEKHSSTCSVVGCMKPWIVDRMCREHYREEDDRKYLAMKNG